MKFIKVQDIIFNTDTINTVELLKKPPYSIDINLKDKTSGVDGFHSFDFDTIEKAQENYDRIINELNINNEVKPVVTFTDSNGNIILLKFDFMHNIKVHSIGHGDKSISFTIDGKYHIIHVATPDDANQLYDKIKYTLSTIVKH